MTPNHSRRSCDSDSLGRRKTTRRSRTAPDYVYIGLPGGKRCIVDADDIPRLAGTWWFVSSGYVRGRVNGDDRSISMARFLLNAPEDLTVDHINHDKLDNRKANLRLCTQAENNRNRRDRPSRPNNYARPVPHDDPSVLFIKMGSTWKPGILSEKETGVFRGLANGKTIKLIAEEMGLSASNPPALFSAASVRS